LINPIQYLRAVAALMVVWAHAQTQVPGTSDLIRLPDFGLSGVDIFFVISGFIMLVTTTEKPLTPRQFIELRIVRVVPLYWIMTLLMIGFALVAPGLFKTLLITPVTVVKSLLFIPYDSLSFPGHPWPVLVPGWTLNYEMFFYVLFALALAISTRSRLWFLVVTMVGLVVAGKVIGPSQRPFVWVYTSPLLLEFAAGAIIGHLWLRGVLRVPILISSAAIVAGIVLLVARGQPPFVEYSQIIGATLLVGGCLHPAICALKSPLLRLLGDASYSIYLTHLFTLGGLRVVWVRLVPIVSLTGAIAFLATALIVSAAAGYMVYRWLEKPLTARLRLIAGGGFKATSAAIP
jgi:exopolysaccharide production protein ExoZ